ncbi:MAG TPA: hypothetical protein VEW69_03680 [Alphaproteobacteria bacterium]|nr:hypothetical protein [Alphaproteobacteria bacterium]
MRKIFALVFLLGSTATIMAAQEIPKIELFGGYNYTNSNAALTGRPVSFNGWSSSVAFNFNKWVGMVADGGGAYRSEEVPPFTVNFPCIINPTICPPPFTIPGETRSQRLYTYSFGPRFSYRNDSRFTPFGHVLFGGGRVTDSHKIIGGGRFTEASGSHVLTLGGGVDYRLTNRLALRTQTDLQQSRFFSDLHDGFRLSTGLVFNFGKK